MANGLTWWNVTFLRSVHRGKERCGPLAATPRNRSRPVSGVMGFSRAEEERGLGMKSWTVRAIADYALSLESKPRLLKRFFESLA